MKLNSAVVDTLRTVHDRYPEMVGEILTEAVEEPVHVKIESFTLTTYAEFTQSLANTEYNYYAINVDKWLNPAYTFYFEMEPLHGQGDIDFSLPMVFALWHHLSDDKASSQIKQLNQVENDEFYRMHHTVIPFILRTLKSLERVWHPKIEVKIKSTGWENVPEEAMLHPDYDTTKPDENVLHLGLRVASIILNGRINLCYPTSMLDPILSKI